MKCASQSARTMSLQINGRGEVSQKISILKQSGVGQPSEPDGGEQQTGLGGEATAYHRRCQWLGRMRRAEAVRSGTCARAYKWRPNALICCEDHAPSPRAMAGSSGERVVPCGCCLGRPRLLQWTCAFRLHRGERIRERDGWATRPGADRGGVGWSRCGA
jgi:hypothetical protein